MAIDRTRTRGFIRACLLALVVASIGSRVGAQPRLEGTPLACVSPAEARDLFVANKLMPPFRIMREAARGARAEAIDIQLCRTQGGLVYDVTLLDPEGRITHRLISASNGVAVNGHPAVGGAEPPKDLPPSGDRLESGEGYPMGPGRLGPGGGYPPGPGRYGLDGGYPGGPGGPGGMGPFGGGPRPGRMGPPGGFPRPGERRPGLGE